MQDRTPYADLPLCSFAGCLAKRHHRNGLCESHERQRRRGESLRPLRVQKRGADVRLCSYPGCLRPYRTSGYCKRHAEHLYRYGAPREIGPYGGGFIDRQGYRVISKRGHPNASTNNGQIKEHTFVMSEFLERPLLPGETVHHKNGVRHDNRLENLELWVSNHPSGQRVEDVVAWARTILERYGSLF